MKKEINPEMTYIEFLKTVQVLKILYGREIAEDFFTKNITEWYNIDNASFSKNVKVHI